MRRNIKSLCLALVVACALGGSTASAVSAAPQFTSEVEPTSILGGATKTYELKVTDMAVSCKIANFFGSMANKTTTSMTIVPEFTTCTAVIGALSYEAKITGFGHYAGEVGLCSFLMKADGTVDLLCDADVEVTIDAGPCTIHIPAQKGLGKVTYSNEKDVFGLHAGTILANVNLTKIIGTHTDPMFCPFNGGGAFAGTWTGESTISGEDNGGKKTKITFDP